MLRSWRSGFNIPFWKTVQRVTISFNCLLLLHSKTVPTCVLFCLVLSRPEFQLAICARPWPVNGCVGLPYRVSRLQASQNGRRDHPTALLAGFTFVANHPLGPDLQRRARRSWVRLRWCRSQ